VLASSLMFAALADVTYKYDYVDYVGCYNQPQNPTFLKDKITGKIPIIAADANSLPDGVDGVIQYCAERAISNGCTENMAFTVSGQWNLGGGCKF
jgi:hypothetical protein